MSYLVGPKGQVITTEIISELATRAQKILEVCGAKNVKVLCMDGFDGVKEGGPFDRIIFTAGAEEFPQKLFENLKEDGLMVFVHRRDRIVSDSDFLEVIRKKNNKPEVKISIPCSFVPVIRNKESRQQDGTL